MPTTTDNELRVMLSAVYSAQFLAAHAVSGEELDAVRDHARRAFAAALAMLDDADTPDARGMITACREFSERVAEFVERPTPSRCLAVREKAERIRAACRVSW